MKKILTFLFLLAFSASAFGEEVGDALKNLELRSCWARAGEVSLENDVEEKGTAKLSFSGSADFCSHSKTIFDVKPGDVYELQCDLKAEGTGNVGISVILGKPGHEVAWTYGNRTIANSTNGQFVHLQTKFIIPDGQFFIQPRVVGYSNDRHVSWIKNYSIRKAGQVVIPKKGEIKTLENDSLKLDFDCASATFSVTDKRSGRVWEQLQGNQTLYVQKVEVAKNVVSFTALNAATVEPICGKAVLEPDKPEVVAVLTGDPETEMSQAISWPLPFKSRENDRILLPVNEGISFPVVEDAPGASSLITYGGHGICMGFWAQCEEYFVPDQSSNADAPNQAGKVCARNACLAIFETSDDGRIALRKPQGEKLLVAMPSWDSQKKKLGYDRVLRYVFFAETDVTNVVKRYRQYADSIGLVVPFTEKVKRNPNLKQGIDLLIGAANVWYFGGNKLEVYSELQKAGIRKILASAGGSAEEIKAMNEIPGILTSRYDIYQDSMNPENFPLLNGKHSDWTSEAWERDHLMTNANGDWIRGWGVAQKDKTKPRIPCGVLCDTCAVPYEMERVAEELTRKPYRARFIDTTTASPWRECWHPKHPCSRTESKKAKMELLGVLGKEFNLVAGSETGHEASVPYCDFYEGMMSLGPYRVPDSGRNITEIWDEAPERTAKYQVGETYRMPLWELVYHDCTVSYWYWGDYNNKLPSLWEKRDLFNALYGVPPMFLFTQQTYPEIKERLFQSGKTAMATAEKTGWHEMTSFDVISKDRTVQQTAFANGLRVTANFGELDFTMPDGTLLKAKSIRIEE